MGGHVTYPRLIRDKLIELIRIVREADRDFTGARSVDAVCDGVFTLKGKASLGSPLDEAGPASTPFMARPPT